MTSISRRVFMRAAAQAAGTFAAAGLLPTGIRNALAIPAHDTTRSIEDVAHVVVLMQENRSFDHYFGTLRGVRGYGDRRAMTLPSGNPVWNQPVVAGYGQLSPYRPGGANLGMKYMQGLLHDWATTHFAWNGGRYDQWVLAKGPTTMAYLTREDVPFHYALADAFTICDAYHCSSMAPTDPNRYYLWTGGLGNDCTGGGPVIDNAEAGYTWSTFPEKLQAAGVSWKIYQDIGMGLDANGSWGWTKDPFIGTYGDNSLLFFNQYRNARPGDALYDNARTGTNAARGDGYFDILKIDVLNDRLPQVSWIVPPEAYSEHPNWPPNFGAWYMLRIELTNRGRAGAAFLLYRTGSSDTPRAYAVEIGKRLSDDVPLDADGHYHYSLHGPNGFFRRFKGSAKATRGWGGGIALPEVTEAYDVANGSIGLRLRNIGSAACEFTVRDAYGSPSVKRRVVGGEIVDVYFDLRASHGWYDLAVLVDTDSSFERGFAGHVETGRGSMSDPAFGIG